MYKLFTDKNELFECSISLQGASLKKSKARLVVETPEYSLLFKGTISKSGKCEIPIKKLKGLIDENTKGNIRLEVIAEDTFFTPWESDFEVDASKKVTVEVKTQTTKKPIIETKVKVNVKGNGDVTASNINLSGVNFNKLYNSGHESYTNKNRLSGYNYNEYFNQYSDIDNTGSIGTRG